MSLLILCVLWANSYDLCSQTTVRLGQARIWPDVSSDNSNYLPVCLSFCSRLFWAHLHDGGCRVERKGKSQCRSTFKLYSYYFPNDSLDKASHVHKTKFREWEKYTLPLARRSCKIDQLSIQIWEEFLTVVIIVVLKSTTFYFIALHY